MSDPVLDAHRRAPLVYTASGPSPISIRDQILRGVTIVHRLLETGLIGPARELAVIGAGAGGATAAIEAARQGVRTFLIESANAPFQTQRFASTRWLDPTQYDWPVDHCYVGRLPWGAQPPLPLAFHAGRSDLLSLRWQLSLIGAVRRLRPRLSLQFRTAVTRVAPINLPPLGLHLRLTLNGTRSIDVGAVIEAKGFGNERCAITDAAGTVLYEGQPFWGPDRFASLSATRHKVLISGSGDGALQDYLRIVTNRHSALDIAQRCNLPASIIHGLQSAEDRAHRGRSWATDDNASLRKKHEAPFFVELENVHSGKVNSVLGNPLTRRGLQRLIPTRPAPVTLVYREPYLTSYYGLNRFLTLLLARYIEQEFGDQALHPGCAVHSIAPTSVPPHSCTMPIGGQMHAHGTYSASGRLLTHTCFEKDHFVTFSPQSGLASATYNVIIVRHGLTMPPPRMQRQRHILPYHRP